MTDRSPKIISQQSAYNDGLKFFFTGSPCARGHIAERYVSNGKCRECDSENNRRRYQRQTNRGKSLFELWPPRPDRVWRGPVGRSLARVRVNGVTLA
jgi:hypothetical protein